MKLELPLPPSLNAMYRMTCRNGYPTIYKSDKAKRWIKDAYYAIKAQTRKRKPIEDDVILYVTVYKKRTVDIDNFMKATQDILEQANIIKNDKQISELHVYRHKATDKEYMELQLETWE